jgi:hypothetical protein
LFSTKRVWGVGVWLRVHRQRDVKDRVIGASGDRVIGNQKLTTDDTDQESIGLGWAGMKSSNLFVFLIEA